MDKLNINTDPVVVTDEFIEVNKLTLNRSIDELKERWIHVRQNILPFGAEVIADFMPFDLVKGDFKEEYVKRIEAGEAKYEVKTDLKEVVNDFLTYMKFAWGKAEDERGISASRSIQKLGEWLWVLGRDDLYGLINRDDLYNPYGAPALLAVCDQLQIEAPESLRAFAEVKVAY